MLLKVLRGIVIQVHKNLPTLLYIIKLNRIKSRHWLFSFGVPPKNELARASGSMWYSISTLQSHGLKKTV